MARKKRIINLERYGNKGWQWQIKRTQYRTNKNGEGLWQYSKTGATTFGYTDSPKPVYNWKQIEGTSQFSLPKDKRKAYRKIYYQFFYK